MQHFMIGARRENQYIPLTLTQGNLIYYENRNRVFINLFYLSREKYSTFQPLAHPQFLHTALPQQRWRGRGKARGRAFTRAETGGQSPCQGSMARVPQWNGGPEISRQRKKPACNQRRATPLFRVREGPSPRLLRANVNGKNWGWATFQLPLTHNCHASIITLPKSVLGSMTRLASPSSIFWGQGGVIYRSRRFATWEMFFGLIFVLTDDPTC